VSGLLTRPTSLWNPDFWTEVSSQTPQWDRLIEQFNGRTGLLAEL
jgi:hypothetical protein